MKPALFCLLSLCAILTFTQCKQDESKKLSKEQIIDRETMIHLMADMEITEAALKFKQTKLKYDSVRILSNRAFDSLYLYYNTTPELFKENLKHYQYDMEDFQEMLEEKINLISRKNDSITLEPTKIDTTGINNKGKSKDKKGIDSSKTVKAKLRSVPEKK